MNFSRPQWLAITCVAFFTLLVLAVRLVATPPGPRLTSSNTVLQESPSSDQPRITWTPASVTLTVSPAQTKVAVVGFTPSKNIRRISVELSRELLPFLSADPAFLEHVRKAQRREIRLTLAAPADARPSTFTGMIQLAERDGEGRRGRRILEQALPVVLNIGVPPDPGEAGKTTLAGVDSDGDGVRDDIQRYIGLTHPDSQKTRAALAQYAKSLQAFVLDATDREASIINARKRHRALDCLIYIRGVDEGVSAALRAQFLNTKMRSQAYIAADANLSGQVFSLTLRSQQKLGCDFDPDALRN